MTLLPRLKSLWRNIFHKTRVEQDLNEELQAYLDLLIEAKIKAGLKHEDARRAALIELGGLEQVKEQVREARIGQYLETLRQDLRYGTRLLLKYPAFSLIAVLTLSLGIGATTAIFSVVNAVLIRTLPIKNSARVVVIHNQFPKVNLPRTQLSSYNFLEYSNQTDLFDITAAYIERNFNLTGQGTPQQLNAWRVTAGFFPLLGIEPLAGRLFTAEEDKDGSHHVVLLSHRLWKSLFNEGHNIIRKSLQLDGENFEIIGIIPANIETLYADVDIWVPMAFTARDLSEERRWSLVFNMLARLQPGTSVQQAQAKMTSLAQKIKIDAQDFNIEVRPIMEDRVGDVRKPLFLLFCAVMVVLLISCVNIANLLLARGSARSHEIAIRATLGAGRNRIIQQMLIESLLIGIAGGALGILLAIWGVNTLIALAPTDLPSISEIRLDITVLAFTLAVSLLSSIIFGLFPALIASKPNLVNALKESGRTNSIGLSRQRHRRLLVIAEVSLAFVLLISACLLLRSFTNLLNVSPGFDPHNVLTLRISLPRTQYSDSARIARFYHDLNERIAALQGVKNAAAAFEPPFTPGGDNSVFSIRDRQIVPGEPPPHADFLFVNGDYFRALKIPLRQGRFFEPADMRIEGPIGPDSAVVIDEAMAKRYWPNSNPIGAGIGFSSQGPWGRVVGVVGNAHLRDLMEEPKGTIYFPWNFFLSTLVIRTTVDPYSLVPAIREQVLAVDPDQPIYDIKTMDERLAGSLAAQRFTVTLLAVFALLALLLATIGLYGIITYLVTERRHEIGIRVALGASNLEILKLVMTQAIEIVLIGVAIGLLAACALTRLMTSLLYGISATDPTTFIVIPLLLITTALLASYIPARRATKVDPIIALRLE